MDCGYRNSLPVELAFNNPESAVLGLIVCIMFIGSILAVPVAPYIADLKGRRFGVVVGCTIMLIGVAFTCIGFNVALFIIGRLIIGFGLGIAQVSKMVMMLFGLKLTKY